MSSIGSLSSSTSNSIYSNAKRITGLASGLDTDSLVEAMVLGTKSKIAQQKQQKQLLQWQMDAYRSISSKLIAFQNKYTSYSSGTNLRSPSFYAKTLISALGENSKYVSVSGSSNSAESLSIAAVKQLAKNTSYVSSSNVSDQKLSSGEVTGDETFTDSSLAGTSLTVGYGSKSFTVTLPSGEEYNTAEEVVDALNKSLSEIDYGTDGEKASDKIKFGLTYDGGIKIGYASDAVAETGNKIEIKGGSEKLLEGLGLEEGDKVSGKGNSITGTKALTEEYMKSLQTTRTSADMLEGKTVTFSYNGISKQITIPSADESDIFDKKTGKADMKKLADYFNKELNREFGSGRIKVEYSEADKELSFQTVNPQTGKIDGTSELKITGGDADALRALDIKAGESNRVNLDASFSESGIIGKNGGTAINEYAVNIKNNKTGEIITISKTVDGKDFDENTSMSDIIKAINASDANVQVSYLSTTDKFNISSTEGGASGDFSIVGAVDENGKEKPDDGSFNLGQAIFGKNLGKKDSSGKPVETDYSATMGQDAIIYVDYDGAGGQDPVAITRSSNSFNLDGLTVTVNGTFGIKKDENGNDMVDGSGNAILDDASEAVTFSAKADTDKIVTAFKEMINDFNEIIKLSNDSVSEKKNRDYPPLTDEQRAEMSEDEIKAWEEKAKAGMLFNSSEVKGFTSAIRFLFSGSSSDIKALEEMGITVSSTYSDHGKISFDEEKFKAAIESNLDGVKELFTAEAKTTVNENGEEVTSKGGIMTQIFDVFEKYAATTGSTKGVFVEKAGAPESPLSVLNNSIQKQMDDIDDIISELQDKLETETENAYNKFASLETYISNMNSQSSWLSSQFGG